jgi:hypothetical protein
MFERNRHLADYSRRVGVNRNGSHAVFVDTRKGRTWTDAWGERRPYDGTNEVDAADNALTNAFYFR